VSAVATAGRHRRTATVLPQPPDDEEKASYAWRSLPFLVTGLFISSLCVIVAQLLFEARNLTALPVAAVLFGAYTLIYLAYQLLSLPVNYAGPGFDLAAHDAWCAAGTRRAGIGGHSAAGLRRAADVIRNTWAGYRS